jgi:hypothetical protein
MITTEGLLTSKDGFGLSTATPVQRASCRVGDGLPLGDLAHHPDVIEAFGGEAAIAALPSEHGLKPVEFYDVSSPRTAKTMRAVCRAIVASQTVDLSDLKVGEVPRVSIMSLKLDTADVPFRLLTGCLRRSEVLRSLIVSIGSDCVEVRHPSGRTVEISVVAGGRAAGGLVARWSAGLIADEGTRMQGDEAVANLPDSLTAIRERLLPGAQIQVIGQPHAPFGPVYEAFQQYFGHPTDEVAVMRTTGPAGNPSYWSRSRLEKLKLRDESAWRVAEFADFLSPESSLFSATALDAATRAAPIALPPSADGWVTHACAIDPATRGNAWTLIVLQCDAHDPNRPRYLVALAHQWVGSKAHPLRTDLVLTELARMVRPYGIREVWTDQWSIDALVPQARAVFLTLRQRNVTALERVDMYGTASQLIEGARLELPPLQQLREDLLRVKKRVTQGGVAIELPRTGDGRHCDFAPALVLAIQSATRAARGGQAGFATDDTTRLSDGTTYEQQLARLADDRLPRRDDNDPYSRLV